MYLPHIGVTGVPAFSVLNKLYAYCVIHHYVSLEGLGIHVNRGFTMVSRGEIKQLFTAALKCFIRLLGNHRVIQGPVRLHKPVAEEDNYVTFQQKPSVSISLSS